MDNLHTEENCLALDTSNASLPAKIAIIGCYGRMGRMLCEKAQEQGIPFSGVDLPYEEKELEQTCSNADLIILCVPARNFEETLKKLVTHVAPDAILADITSVKEKPMKLMEEIWPGKVVGTHPLFGPHPQKNTDLSVAIISGGKATEEDVAKVGKFFSSWGCKPFTCTASHHDKALARIQNMNFITNLAYFAVLADHKELLPFLTPSFERRKKAAAKMLTEDANMFSGLFEANDYSHEAVRQYRKMLNVAASGDIDLLCQKAKWWWNDKNTNK